MDPKLIESVRWREIGPHRGGRVVAVAGHPTEIGTFYFGACAGGVWKTTSGGAYWENVSDGYFGTSAIGAIAVPVSDPNVIYVGTGESEIRSNVSHGDGVYKSTDGGRSWVNLGLKDTRHIGDIEVHPTNSDLVYVAALGHAWGPNEERGVFRSKDGGKNWERVLYKSDQAGCHDIAMDASNPRVLFAAIWQAQRHPHTLASGGEDSGIWRSMDGGDTWEDVTRHPGLPEDAVLGKIGVTISPAQAGRVWALIEAENGGLFRSDDYGDTWTRLTENMDLRRRPWYYMHVFADPSDADTIWVLNVNCWKSTDGGKTFDQIPTPHGDNHGLWIDPENSSRIIEGNDGGACVSFDGGRHWSTILNQPTAQFYHVTTDNQTPYNIYGSQQDNWAMKLPSVGHEGAITWTNYVEPGGGESGYIAVSRKAPHRVFAGGIGTGLGNGRMLAWNPLSGHKRNVTVWPEVVGFGAGAAAMKYRFQWTFPIEFSPHDPDVLYACSNHVHKSTDEGETWEVISPDLTTNNPELLGSSGGPITADNSGAEVHCTIFAFVESPIEAGVLWAGSDDGVVHISRDAGKTWNNVTPDGLEKPAMVSIIEASTFNAGTAYVTATRYKVDDLKPYIFRTSDYGASWQLVTDGIPADEFTRVVREDPSREGLLYCGTEVGLHVSFDRGDNWQPFQSNLPVAPIHDLTIKNDDLIAATHGRSFWLLDDLSPLHHAEQGMEDQDVVLFKPRDTTRYRVYGRAFGRTPNVTNYKMTGPVTVAYRPTEAPSGAPEESFLDAGANPPDGVIVHYYLKNKPSSDMRLDILDAEGNVVRSYSSVADEKPKLLTQPGSHQIVWDMRGAKPTALEDAGAQDRFAQMMESAVAPRVVGGTYQARLTVDGNELTESFRVLPDPRIDADDRALAEQFELKSAIRDEVSRIHEALNQLRSVRGQLNAWSDRAGKDDANKGIYEQAARLKADLDAIEATLLSVNASKPRPGASAIREKLVSLSIMIDESDDRPTQGGRDVYAMLADQVETTTAQLRRALFDDIAALNKKISSSALPPIVG